MPHSEHHKIGKRAGVISLFTFLSRIFGMARDTVVAYFFGASSTADAFYVAFRIPNLLRRLTAEGALTIAFVPIFTEYLRKSRKEGKEVASVVFTYLSIALVIISMLGVIFAPFLVKLIAYGFTSSPAKFTLTVYLTRLMFPYILLISLTALAMGILNSLKHFAAPAASPVLLNVFIIIGAAVFSRWFAEPTVGLAIGVLVGGVSQLCLQIPVLVKKGMLPHLNFNYRHPALKSLLLMMAPAAFGAAVYQVNVLIVTLLASFLPHGSVSYLWYADRVTEFPLGIFAIAIATATLPTLSDHAVDKNIESFKQTFRYSLKGAFAETIPAAVGLYILAVPIVKLLFERGVFKSSDTIGVAGALCFFLIGMPFVSGVRNTVPAFFAMKDARTPVIVSSIVVVINAGLALLLMGPLIYRGLALALAISNIFNFIILIIALRRKIGQIGFKEIAGSMARIAGCSAVMGAVVWYANNYVFASLIDKGFKMLSVAILSSILLGVATYFACLKLIKAPEFELLITAFRRKRQEPRHQSR